MRARTLGCVRACTFWCARVLWGVCVRVNVYFGVCACVHASVYFGVCVCTFSVCVWARACVRECLCVYVCAYLQDVGDGLQQLQQLGVPVV